MAKLISCLVKPRSSWTIATIADWQVVNVPGTEAWHGCLLFHRCFLHISAMVTSFGHTVGHAIATVHPNFGLDKAQVMTRRRI